MSRAQLLGLGLSKHAIHTLIAAGQLLALHRAVFAVGHRRLTMRGHWMAAVLACAEGAVLGHGHAAALHNLRTAPSTAIDVTVPARRAIPGLRCHRARTLHPADVTRVDAIPVTTVARTLLDDAETLPPQRLRSRLEETLRLEVFDYRQFEVTMGHNPGRAPR